MYIGIATVYIGIDTVYIGIATVYIGIATVYIGRGVFRGQEGGHLPPLELFLPPLNFQILKKLMSL